MNSLKEIWSFFNLRWLAVLVLLLSSWGLWELSDAHFRWSGGQEKVPVRYNLHSDGAAYYAYLPYWFYHEGEDYSFFDKINERYPDSRFDDNLGLGGGAKKRFNKYYTGTAVLITPFFLTAHIIESAKGAQTDGYSTTYLFMLSIAAIFYWLVGALALYLLLVRLKIPVVYALLTILVITFGTNLFHYAIYAPACSHIYSFACTSWLLNIAHRWAKNGYWSDFLLMALLIGLAFIIRPTNVIVVLFIPFLFDSLQSFVLRLKVLFTRKIVQLLLFIVVFGLPFIFHFSNLSSFNSYKDEGFDHLANPYILEVLFGVRRGIFFYAPVLVLALLGLIVLFKRKRTLFWGFVLTFSVFTYLISSWWCWWYGGSFSMRPFVDVMALFAIPMAFLFYRLHVVLKIAAGIFVIAAVGMTQVFNYQFNNNIIHYDGMSWMQFKTTFLQTSERFEWYPYLTFNKLPDEGIEKVGSISFQNKAKLPNHTYSITHVSKDQSDDRFAAQINGTFILHSSYGKPHFRLSYFKNDSVFHEDDIFFGAFIPDIHEKTELKLDIYPEITMNTFDSVRITLFDVREKLQVEGLELHLFTKDKEE